MGFSQKTARQLARAVAWCWSLPVDGRSPVRALEQLHNGSGSFRLPGSRFSVRISASAKATADLAEALRAKAGMFGRGRPSGRPFLLIAEDFRAGPPA